MTRKRGDLVESAERRWSTIRQARPDLAPALDLQRGLLTHVIDLEQALRAARLPRLSLPPKYLAAKLARGVPVFAGEPIPLPVPALTPVLRRLCEALAAGGAGDPAARIGDAVASGQIEPASLFAASLARNQTAIRTGAAHRGLAPDLVWLVAELTVSPLVHLLQRSLCSNPSDDRLQLALEAWNHGYCPACGSWPAVAEVVVHSGGPCPPDALRGDPVAPLRDSGRPCPPDALRGHPVAPLRGGHRVLRCSFCSSAWELTTYACIYCQNGGEKFVTAAPSDARKDRRVEVCSSCGGYLKTVDVPELSPFPLLSISDIETTELDVAAMEHGYARPALKEFTARR